MKILAKISASDLRPALDRLWPLSARKLEALRRYDHDAGAPVFTVRGRYTARGWTEWTQGFVFGSGLLQYEAAGDAAWLDWARRETYARMPAQVTHFGVHDHGFNIVSTYGALLRLFREGRAMPEGREEELCRLALRCSGAVQARRWTALPGGGGFVYSFNGPHSLFIDTLRSLRSLALAHTLGQPFLGEHDARLSLLARAVAHARTTARWNVYYGEGRDAYDVPGRVAHESIFNIADGAYRCPSSQQGYSPFTTWMRGLAWAMLGFAEQLEFVAARPADELDECGGRADVEAFLLRAARAACDRYLLDTPADGVPYWDAGAPGLAALGDWRGRAAEPFNAAEPVDSSAAAIAAQGLLRLGRWLTARGDVRAGGRYERAGLTVLRTLLAEPYLGTQPRHEGLLLHSVYHRPNGWDFVPKGQRVPCGEASLWGDYHVREVALLVQRMARGEPWYGFLGACGAYGSNERKTT